MVEYVGILKMRALNADGMRGAAARQEYVCAAKLGAQSLKTGAKLKAAEPKGAADGGPVWDEVLLLCWDGRDALHLAVNHAKSGRSVGACCVTLDDLPALTPKIIEVPLQLEGEVEGVTWQSVCPCSASPSTRSASRSRRRSPPPSARSRRCRARRRRRARKCPRRRRGGAALVGAKPGGVVPPTATSRA